MPYKDLFFTGTLVGIRCNVDVFKKWQFIFPESEGDLNGSSANENWNFLFLIHSYVTKVFNIPKMNCSFQEPFFACIGQLIKIGNILADNRAVF